MSIEIFFPKRLTKRSKNYWAKKCFGVKNFKSEFFKIISKIILFWVRKKKKFPKTFIYI